jgi:hypothetical protein
MAKRAEVPDWETLLAHAAALQAKIPSVGGGRIRLPTVGETLRIKTFLMVDRNATRDYLDVAALSVSLGLRKSAMALERMNEIYSEFAGERGDMLTSALVKLAAPDPYDLTDDLTDWCRKEDSNWSPKLQIFLREIVGGSASYPHWYPQLPPVGESTRTVQPVETAFSMRIR